MFNRSRLNLSHWFALSMGAIFTVFAGILYHLQADQQLFAFDEELYQKAKLAEAKAQHYLDQGKWQVKPPPETTIVERDVSPSSSELVYARWYDINGKLVHTIGEPSAPQALTVKGPLFQTIRFGNSSPMDILTDGRSLRQFTTPIKHEQTVIGYFQTASLLAPLEMQLNQMLLIMTLGVPITLGAIGLTGWILGGIAMQPIRHSYERLQRFTADASHELRTPLAAILSNAQIAIMPAFRNSEQQQQCLDEVEKAAKSMSGLLDNLLFLARHEGPLTKVALNQSLSAIDLLGPLVGQYKERAVQDDRCFISQLPKQTLYLRADEQLLRRAVTNLLDNAFKYTPAGGTIQLHCFPQSHHAVVQVVDDGVGIPEADLPHIFDRFYRVDMARSRQTGGFGLGLSIAEQIVQAHNGKIMVKSAFGQGTTFTIEVPLYYGRLDYPKV